MQGEIVNKGRSDNLTADSLSGELVYSLNRNIAVEKKIAVFVFQKSHKSQFEKKAFQRLLVGNAYEMYHQCH